ncbi:MULTISPECIES: hypothetical protein [unclassified Endozoicomonas]|uniref:hypothetical protein n=1 Tax=unclassified Endozoicomonas TaxID=2644528 RepID=UPI003BB712AA
MSNPHIGSSFDDFLEEEGLLPECQAEAIKRVPGKREGQQINLCPPPGYQPFTTGSAS